MLKQIKMIADAEHIDHLIIESTGISEPGPVAEVFHFPVDAAVADGKKLGDFAYIDSMVTVVDPQNFMKIYLSDEEKDALPGEDAKALAELLVEQIEHADTLVLTRADTAAQSCVDFLRSFLERVNPAARILRASHGVIDPGEIIGTRGFSYSNLTFLPDALTLQPSPSEADVYAFQSMVWRARRPVDPAKFFAVMESLGQFGKILRCKGFLWVCTVPDKIVAWQQAAMIFRHEIRGMWWMDTPRPHWPRDARALSWIDAKWESGVGDRRQELVFIGRDMDTERLAQALEQCLLSPVQCAQSPSSWRHYPDPFEFQKDDTEYLQHGGAGMPS